MSFVEATLCVGAKLAVDAPISTILTIPVRPSLTLQKNKVSVVPNLILVGTTKGICVTCITRDVDKNKIGIVRVTPCHCGPIYDMVYNSCTNTIATAGHDGTCTIMPLHLLVPQELLRSSHNVNHNNVGHRKRSREHSASNADEQHWELCQTGDVVLQRRLRGHTLPVVSVRFTFDGNTLLSLGVNGRLIVFSLSSQHIVFEIDCNFIACTLELSSDESSCFIAGTKLFCVDFGNQEQRLAIPHEQTRRQTTSIMFSKVNDKQESQTHMNNVIEYTWSTEESSDEIRLYGAIIHENEENYKTDSIGTKDNNYENERSSVAIAPLTSQENDACTSHSCNNAMDKELSKAKQPLCIKKIILNECDGSIIASCILLHESFHVCDSMQGDDKHTTRKFNVDNRKERKSVILYWSHNSTCGKCIHYNTNSSIDLQKNKSKTSLTSEGQKHSICKSNESNATLNRLVLEEKKLERCELMWSLLSASEDKTTTTTHDKHSQIYENTIYEINRISTHHRTQAHNSENEKGADTSHLDNYELTKDIAEQRQRKLRLENECARLMHELKKYLVNKTAKSEEEAAHT